MRSLARHRTRMLLIVSVAALTACVATPFADARARMLTRIPDDDAAVALTFDDGPDPRHTPEVLAILHSEGVPATFFVIGSKVEAASGIDYRGHLVGFHTYSHANGFQASARAQIADFERGIAAVPGTWPTEPACFRSPFGRAWPATIRWADQHGTYLGWSVCYDALIHDTRSPRGVLPHEKRVATVLAKIKPGDIVLFHDGNGNAKHLVEDLPAIIRALKSRGYRFVTPRDFAGER